VSWGTCCWPFSASAGALHGTQPGSCPSATADWNSLAHVVVDFGSIAADGLDLDQFLATGHHHLRHFLETDFELTQGLFRIAVGSVLNARRLVTAPLNQPLALLLGLLPELQGIVMESLSFLPTLTLQAQALPADGLQFLQGLLTACLMLLGVLSLDLSRILFQLLTTLLSLLFQLLTTSGELLLLLRQLALHLLFQLGALLTGGLQQLLALLPCLFAKFENLPLCLLTHRGGAHQLFMLTLGLLNDLVCLLLGGIDELIATLQKLSSTLNLLGQRLTDCIQNFDGITFVDQTTATEGNATALKKNILQLIQMIEDNQASVAHVTGV
tara:strand:+ start:1983 stop:2963 length:981 start_codon:yes stop_codon:yes gene_type:complete